jgi:hypothetical protein
MFRFTARSKSTASLVSVVVLASALLAPAAIAAPASAGNSFDVPVVHHSHLMRTHALYHRTALHHRVRAGSTYRIHLRGAGDAGKAAPFERPSAAGNSFEIPQENGRAM